MLWSFILTLGLFYYISGEESVDIERKAVLRLEAPEGMTIIGGPEREITVTLSAPRNLLSLIGGEELGATHTIEGVVNPGDYSFTLRDYDIALPRAGIRVTDIQPRTLTVTLDQVITKKLFVKANIVGEPAAGYAVDFANILKDPNAAVVKGPKRHLEKKKYILTDTIDVVGRIRSFRIRVPLKYSSQYSVDSKELIDVFVPLKQQAHKKTFEGVSINVLNANLSSYYVTIEPSTLALTLKGPKELIEGLDKNKILAYVNVTKLTRGEYQLPLMLNLPSEVSLEGDVPIVKVTIEEPIKEIPVATTAEEGTQLK